MNKDLAIKTGSSVIGAGVGAVIAGVPGALIGSILTPIAEDVLNRMLSVKERNRVEKVRQYAESEIKRMIDSGSVPKQELDRRKVSELYEGVLLKAKSTYEEKKLPYIANLFAIAPFTNTPIENINQSLITAEQLSYRQLCLLGILDEAQFKDLSLSDKPL